MAGQRVSPPSARAAIQPPAGTPTVPVQVWVPAAARPAADQATRPFTTTSTRSKGKADDTVSVKGADEDASPLPGPGRTSPGSAPPTVKRGSGPFVTKLRPARRPSR